MSPYPLTHGRYDQPPTRVLGHCLDLSQLKFDPPSVSFGFIASVGKMAVTRVTVHGHVSWITEEAYWSRKLVIWKKKTRYLKLFPDIPWALCANCTWRRAKLSSESSCQCTAEISAIKSLLAVLSNTFPRRCSFPPRVDDARKRCPDPTSAFLYKLFSLYRLLIFVLSLTVLYSWQHGGQWRCDVDHQFVHILKYLYLRATTRCW